MRMLSFRLMDPEPGNGGGGPAAANPPAESPSAFTEIVSKTEGNHEDENGSTGNNEPPSSEAKSAFAQITKKADANAEEQKDPTREELSAMSDEDWAKGVLPDDKDAEGNEIDRTFMTSMAKVCREAGISPRQMKAMSERFQELANEELARQNAAKEEQDKALEAANAAAMKTASEKFDDRQRADIAAAAQKYVPAGSELYNLMCGPLGSNVELLTILSVVGKSLRGAAPNATGAAGSGESDPALAVVMKTCGVALGKN